MVASIFKSFISKYFAAISQKMTAKVNDKEGEPVYLHKQYLRPEFSPDMKFSSLSTNNRIVAADVVALDSPLPLKKRGSYKSAEGEIPKLGMKKSMNESMLQQLKNLQARGNKEKELVRKLFSDAIDGVKGIWERLDIMLLQAASTGVALIGDDYNTGTGIRVDYGIPTKNQFGVQTLWSDANAVPVEDIERVIAEARADGYTLNTIWMDKRTYNAFKRNAQVLEAFAGFNKINKDYVFRISRSDMDEFLREEFQMSLVVIDKVVQVEKDGKTTAIEPWQEGMVTFTVGTQLGTLAWSELAEIDSPVKDVEYSVVDSFILTSLYRTNDPLKENTSVQALAIPVLDNVDSIFLMNTKEATASLDSQTEGDSTYTYDGTDYTKQSVVDGINAARAVDTEVAEAKITNQDATLAKKIDQLSEKGIELFEAELVTA